MTDVVAEGAGHLEKAKAALAAAREVTLEIHELAEDEDKSRSSKTRTQIELLDIAKVQALTSIAESLESLVRATANRLTDPPADFRAPYSNAPDEA